MHAYRFIDNPFDVEATARALAGGAVVATAFGNFYVMVANPALATVQRINLAKGRPVNQVGSIRRTRVMGCRSSPAPARSSTGWPRWVRVGWR